MLFTFFGEEDWGDVGDNDIGDVIEESVGVDNDLGEQE
jgi:hypothetical protein